MSAPAPPALASSSLRRRANTVPWLLALLSLTGCEREPVQQGHYYWGHEVNVVCPCGSKACYWVRGEQLLLGPLRHYVQTQTSQPYQPVYLEYRGELLSEPGTGYAANYEGYLELSEVLTVSVALPKHCPRP